jgi:hypothetical protein
VRCFYIANSSTAAGRAACNKQWSSLSFMFSTDFPVPLRVKYWYSRILTYYGIEPHNPNIQEYRIKKLLVTCRAVGPHRDNSIEYFFRIMAAPYISHLIIQGNHIAANPEETLVNFSSFLHNRVRHYYLPYLLVYLFHLKFTSRS